MKNQALKMGWDVTDLVEKIGDDATEILRKQVLSGQTLSLITTQQGVKYKDKIKLFDVDIVWQDGSTCGFNASGDAKFSDREIEVHPIKLQLEFCNLDLLEKWTRDALSAGSIAELEDFPYEDVVIGYLNEKNAWELDKAVWRSDKDNVSGNFQFFDGFEKLFDDEKANMVDINTNNYTVIDATNAYDVIYDAYSDFLLDDTGAAILETGEAIAMVTRQQFLALIKNITDLNKFHFDTQAATGNGSFVLPGTDLTVVMIKGRNDNNKFYIGRPSSLRFGTDLENDFEQVKIWYEDKDEKIYVLIRFKAGTQIPFPEEIGYFELAAS